MADLYRVKLLEGHHAKKDQVKKDKDGDLYVAWLKKIQYYNKGEAIKKARMFGGVIEQAHWIEQAQENNRRMFETYGLYGRIDITTVGRVMSAYIEVSEKVSSTMLPKEINQLVYTELKKGKYYED